MSKRKKHYHLDNVHSLKKNVLNDMVIKESNYGKRDKTNG